MCESKEENDAYRVYLKERAELIKAQAEETHKFDKAILTLAGGSFGFSLAFIKEIVPIIKPGTFQWLLASWAGFGLSLLSTMVSFLVSQAACRSAVEILEHELLNKEKREESNKAGAWTMGLNICSIAAFILGVVLLVVFVAKNVPH